MNKCGKGHERIWGELYSQREPKAVLNGFKNDEPQTSQRLASPHLPSRTTDEFVMNGIAHCQILSKALFIL